MNSSSDYDSSETNDGLFEGYQNTDYLEWSSYSTSAQQACWDSNARIRKKSITNYTHVRCIRAAEIPIEQ